MLAASAASDVLALSMSAAALLAACLAAAKAALATSRVAGVMVAPSLTARSSGSLKKSNEARRCKKRTKPAAAEAGGLAPALDDAKACATSSATRASESTPL